MLPECDHAPLSPPAHRACYVEQRALGSATWEYKGPQWWKLRGYLVNGRLKFVHATLLQGSLLTSPPDSLLRWDGKGRPYCQQVVLDCGQQRALELLRLLGRCYSNCGIEFVYITVGRDLGAVLGDPLPAKKRRLSVVTSPGIDLHCGFQARR